jgi:hypothetical protein
MRPHFHLLLLLFINLGLAPLTPDLHAAGPDSTPQFVNLPIGQTLHLADYGGPHVDLVVNGTDIGNINFVTYDYDHMQVRPYSDPVTHYVTTRTVPTQFNGQVAKGTGATKAFDHPDTLLYKSDLIRVYFIDDISVPQNSVSIAIVHS